jgi:hypothetical protein
MLASLPTFYKRLSSLLPHVYVVLDMLSVVRKLVMEGYGTVS